MTEHVNFDDQAVVTIYRVGPKAASGLFFITDSLGRKYVTRSELVASLAERYRAKSLPCKPVSYPGWFRQLVGVEPV